VVNLKKQISLFLIGFFFCVVPLRQYFEWASRSKSKMSSLYKPRTVDFLSEACVPTAFGGEEKRLLLHDMYFLIF